MTILIPLLLALQTHPVAEVDSAVRNGIASGVYPGAVVVVGTRDSVLLARGYGHMTWSSGTPTPTPDATLYDLASLTKVVATTPAVMILVDRGMLNLDRPVGDYLEEFRGDGKEAVTVRHLLNHTSGLRAFLPLNRLTSDAAAARQLVVSEPLRWAPGSRVVYSDLNAMLLGWIVERVTGMSLDEFVAAEIYAPVGMRHTRFKPPASERSRAAPVNVWRGHVIRGVAHDQNAVRLGGVSGHAGLFATGADLARYAQLYLNQGRAPDGQSLWDPKTVATFTHRSRGNRGLGWEVRDTTTSDNTGALLSPAAFGHGGFTGTSIWIDPERNLFVVILTNRVFAPRTRRSITELKQIRGAIADAAVRLGERACWALAVAAADDRLCQ